MSLDEFIKSFYSGSKDKLIYNKQLMICGSSVTLSLAIVTKWGKEVAYQDKNTNLFFLVYKYWKGEKRINNPKLWHSLIKLAPHDAAWDTDHTPQNNNLQTKLRIDAIDEIRNSRFDEIKKYHKLESQLEQEYRIRRRTGSEGNVIMYELDKVKNILYKLYNPSSIDVDFVAGLLPISKKKTKQTPSERYPEMTTPNIILGRLNQQSAHTVNIADIDTQNPEVFF